MYLAGLPVVPGPAFSVSLPLLPLTNMALTKDQKTAQIQELTAKLKDAQSVMFSHYIGLSVADVSDLRKQLRENGAEMKVAKKTLMKLAFKEAGYPDIEPDDVEGAVACIFSFNDPLSGAQTAFKFSKQHDKVALVGGVFDGKVLTKEQANELAQMPGREELLAKFVGMLRSPLVSFASLCSSPLGGFARALDQMAEKGGFTEDSKESEPTEEQKPEEASAESDDTTTEDSSESSDSSASSESSAEEKSDEEETKEESSS